MTAEISTQVNRFNEWKNEILLRKQRMWVGGVRNQQTLPEGISEENWEALLTEFESFPCMNDLADGGPLEQIVPGHVYVYLPADIASSCQNQQSLAPIPDWMCSGNWMKIVALTTPPNTASKEKIVEAYHACHCYQVDEDDIQRCLVIPKTDMMNWDGIAHRRRRIPYDVITSTKV
ncbi:hypothetical protein [Mesorhizobium sp. ORM16]|uniref:hypothetical protein n=1 Tax=Mesorhizobium sp. ORM16 TaxID=3376989 RepID=UPI003857E2C2